MIRLFTKTIHLPVALFHEKARAGEVSEIVISPDNGVVLGFLIRDMVVKRIRLVPSVEIRSITDDFLLVNDYESVTEIEDVARVTEALKIRPMIIKSKVYTDSGVYLGKVNEATFNSKSMTLENIFVTPAYSIAFFATDLVVNLNKITRIEEKKIYVKDSFVKAKRAAKANIAMALDN